MHTQTNTFKAQLTTNTNTTNNNGNNNKLRWGATDKVVRTRILGC